MYLNTSLPAWTFLITHFASLLCSKSWSSCACMLSKSCRSLVLLLTAGVFILYFTVRMKNRRSDIKIPFYNWISNRSSTLGKSISRTTAKSSFKVVPSFPSPRLSPSCKTSAHLPPTWKVDVLSRPLTTAPAMRGCMQVWSSSLLHLGP